MNRRPSLVVAIGWALGAAVPATAQFSLEFPGYVGIAGGTTVSKLWERVPFSQFSINTSDRHGWIAGGIAGHRLSARTAILLEVTWSQLGGADIPMDYISVPLTFGGILTKGMFRIRPYLGVSVDFLQLYVNNTRLLSFNSPRSTQWTMPVGGTFGLGMAGGEFVGLDVRYAVPLSNAFENTEVNNRSWLFRLVLAKAVGRRVAQSGSH